MPEAMNFPGKAHRDPPMLTLEAVCSKRARMQRQEKPGPFGPGSMCADSIGQVAVISFEPSSVPAVA
jgi:hypothetical protein